MSVDPATGTITVSKNKHIGTYYIKVIGTLPDLVTSAFAVFTIIITTNTVPIFNPDTNLTHCYAHLMKSTTY